MLSAACAHGIPMMVIAITSAAISQPAAIHRPPQAIHNRLSKSAKIDIAGLRGSMTMPPSVVVATRYCREDGYCGGGLPARGRGWGPSRRKPVRDLIRDVQRRVSQRGRARRADGVESDLTVVACDRAVPIARALIGSVPVITKTAFRRGRDAPMMPNLQRTMALFDLETFADRNNGMDQTRG